MRITGLHLKAYGHFAGCSLHFGREPGLHVIYGHNEAGKSTTLRALSSVLFGYPHGVVDGFRHDARDIALGIDLLAADGRALSFERRRRGKRVLTAADGSALDEAAIESFLGGVSQDIFEKVFALDHRRLREHAQALLADGGSLGFSLAEAGSGIAGLKAVLDNLEAERRSLFLPSGARPKLNQAITEVVRLRREARQSAVSPAEYRNHEQRIRETETELQKVRDRRKEVESAIVRLQRIEKNLPLRAQHRVLTQRIAELDGVPVLPPEFAQQRVKASADLDDAREALEATSAAIAELERRIDGIAVDAAVLERADVIERLAQKRPVIEKYQTDIPKREAERNGHIARVGELVAKAELGDAADIAGQLPSLLRRRAIQTSAGEGKKLKAKHAAMLDSVEAAARNLRKAQDGVALAPRPLSAGDLSRELAKADRLGDIVGDIAKRTRTLERRMKALYETVAGLGLPPRADGSSAEGGDRIVQLRELSLPLEKTETRYAAALADVDRKIKKVRDDIEHWSDALAEIEGRIAAMKVAGDLATEDDLKAARESRDHGWALVRGLYVDRRSGLEDAVSRFAPDGRVAETYEARVRDADKTVDSLRLRAAESAKLAHLKHEAMSLATKRAEATDTLKVLDLERSALLSEWRALWPSGLITVQSPGEMSEWLARRRDALAAADSLEEERDAIRERLEHASQAKQALAAAIAAFDASPVDGGLDALREQARSLIEENAAAKSRRDSAEANVRDRSEDKIRVDEEAQKIESNLRIWTDKWRKVLAEAGLPSGLSIEMAEATLEIINEIDVHKSKIEGLNADLELMQSELDSFADAVAAIASALPGAPAGAGEAVCRWLEQRLRAARQDASERKNLAEQLKIHTADRVRADDKLRRGSAALDALCLQAGGIAPDELAEIESRSADKREALRDREQIEKRVREDGDGRDFAALFAECDEVPAGEIPAALVSLRADRKNIEDRYEKLMAEYAEQQAAFNTLLSQNQAADLNQRAAVLDADIAESVEYYVDLTIQEILLRAAIDVYRDRNQGPILSRARDLFVQLTGRAYSGLRADVGERGETMLMVEDGARRSLTLDALSDGTMDAVYLALRLAVVQEHNATREPLPFIADDLLLNLDNRRSVAALRTLADVAKSGQVLLFTHHAHMVELARDAVPADLLVEHDLSQRRLGGPNDGPGDGLPDAAE